MNTHISHHRPSSRGLLVGLFAAGSLALAFTAAAPAMAAETTAPQSCWTDVDTGASGCYDASLGVVAGIESSTGTDVVAVPTGTATPSAAARSAVTASTLSATTTFVLVTAYDTTGRTGTSMSYTTTNTNICNATTYSFNTLGTWNDRIESFQSFNGCESEFFSEVLLSGTTFGPAIFSDDMGTFKNTAASLLVD